jgi:hypothetical protein
MVTAMSSGWRQTVHLLCSIPSKAAAMAIRRTPPRQIPITGLTHVNGTLYGTTYLGGAHGDGTVFAITR